MQGVVFYAGAIGFLLGVAAGSVWAVGLVEVCWLLVVAFGAACVWRRGSEASPPPVLPLILAVLLIAGAVGALRVELASLVTNDTSLQEQLGHTVTRTGIIEREPDIRARNQHVYTRIENQLVLVTTERFQQFSYGDEITVTGEVSVPESFATDLGRTFNYPGYLEAQGVTYLIPFATVTKISSGHGNWFVATLLRGKHAFMTSLEAIIPEPQVGLAEGLLLGVKRALGEDLTTVFRRTGIIHIVVLSGYNVALVVTFVMYILSYLVPFRARVCIGVGAIIAFALTVGLSATVLRASIMAALILIAQASGRIYLITRALLFTAVVMVFLNPPILLYDPGFQLSFLATLGLIVGAPWLQSKLGFVPKAIGVREFLTATLVTQVFVLPLLLYQIGEFSVVAVVVNVLVLPMVPVAMLLTFLTGLVGIVSSTIALPLAYLTTFSLAYILVVAEFFAAVPFASFVVPAFPLWVVPLAYSALGGLLWLVYRTPANDAVEDWVIVEESSLENEKTGAETDVSSPAPPPIFFR